jgi:protein-disulfide isomerase
LTDIKVVRTLDPEDGRSPARCRRIDLAVKTGRDVPMVRKFAVAFAFASLVLLADQALAKEFALGSEDAKVTIIEYASMSCPHCRRFHMEVLPWLKETYIDTGEVRLVYRDFPLNRSALFGAMLVECSGPEHFFDTMDMLFRQQESWAYADDPKEGLAALAPDAGLDADAFDECMADRDMQLRIVESRAKAIEDYEIDQTPSFLIAGEVYGGVLSPDEITELVDKLSP